MQGRDGCSTAVGCRGRRLLGLGALAITITLCAYTLLAGRYGLGPSFATRYLKRLISEGKTINQTSRLAVGAPKQNLFMAMYTTNGRLAYPGYLVVVIRYDGHWYRYLSCFDYHLARVVGDSMRDDDSFSDQYVAQLLQREARYTKWMHLFIESHSTQPLEKMKAIGFEKMKDQEYRQMDWALILFAMTSVLLFCVGFWLGKRRERANAQDLLLVNNYSNAGVLIKVMKNVSSGKTAEAQSILKTLIDSWVASYEANRQFICNTGIDTGPADKMVKVYKEQ